MVRHKTKTNETLIGAAALTGKRAHAIVAAALALVILLAAALGGCGIRNTPAETAGPASTTAPVSTPAPSGSPEPAVETPQQDGERSEGRITLEGMEETVRYEHIRNESLGIEMDYDYELFVRRNEADRERFISVYDDPVDPENYLEVTYRPEDADTAASALREELSQNYELLTGSYELDRAGSCLRIEASELKDGGGMADRLQVVYILPASDGCRVAAEHFTAESAEGFGRRFFYMLNTLAVIGGNGEITLSDEQALYAVRNYCFSRDPELESMVNSGEYPVYWEIASSDEQEVVVLFRAYTGALVYYYVNRTTGETSAGVFVPGISAGEEPTDESFNVRDYLF